MQKKTRVIVTAALLLVSGFYAITQQTLEYAEPVYEVPGLGLNLDLETLRIVGPDPDQTKYDSLNTSKMITERAFAFMAAVEPARYEKYFPKSEDEVRAQQESAHQISNPKTYEEKISGMTPEQLAEWEWSWKAVLNPQEYYEEIQRKSLQASSEISEQAPTNQP